MKLIRISLDRHYPYNDLQFDPAKFRIKRYKLRSSLPASLGKIVHLLELYMSAFKADIILGNRRSALMLGLLFHVYKPVGLRLIGYEIIFVPRTGWRDRLVTFFWRMAVAKIDKLVVQSEEERYELADRFSTHEDKLSFIPFYTENAPYIGPDEDGYLFTAGRMERDFLTLMKAVNSTSLPLVIVADQSYQAVLEPHRATNIQIYYNIPKEEYLQLLKKAKIVVVGLKSGSSSRGQVVVLEAMKYGKAVVASRAGGMHHYLRDGYSGWLLTPEAEASLRKLLLEKFDDLAELEKIGKQARQEQQQKFSLQAFQQHYEKLILSQYHAQ
ncbi:MAG: glycosyltransferase family 4 protein [Cyclobacteriaceae bacterium]